MELTHLLTAYLYLAYIYIYIYINVGTINWKETMRTIGMVLAQLPSMTILGFTWVKFSAI